MKVRGSIGTKVRGSSYQLTSFKQYFPSSKMGSMCRGEKSLSFFEMRHLMPSLGSSAQKMIFLLYRPNFLLFPKEEKEKSCNNLKTDAKPETKSNAQVGERFQVRGLVIRREGISTQRIYSTL